MSRQTHKRTTADTVETMVNNLAIERGISRTRAIALLEWILADLKAKPPPPPDGAAEEPRAARAA